MKIKRLAFVLFYRTSGFLAVLMGAGIIVWVLYNLFIERQPEFKGDWRRIFSMAVPIGLLYVGIYWLRKQPTFTPLEERLLSELKSRLDPKAAEILMHQIGVISDTRRTDDYREVHYYGRRESSKHFLSEIRELNFASIEFTGKIDTKPYKAEFHLVNGDFSSITFTPDSKKIRNAEEINITSVNILHDPMGKVVASYSAIR